MPHPYPRHDPRLPYTGKHHYFLTFCTEDRARTFEDSLAVTLVREQFLRALRKYHFELTAYCFMPDHVHLLVRGLSDDCDCKAFVSAAKQYSGYHFTRRSGRRLWQRYGFERVVRDDREVVTTICYIVMNPVRAGLVERPGDYRHLGSEQYSVDEMMEMCRDLDPESCASG